MIKACYTLLASLGIWGCKDERLIEIDHVMKRAFEEDASTVDYANAVLVLPYLEEELKQRKKREPILTWVDLRKQSDGALYSALQRLKKEYGR